MSRPAVEGPHGVDEAIEIGVVGDLHGAFDAADVALLDDCRYRSVWFVGDLGPGTPAADVRVAKLIARMKTPVMVMPGNNDCANAPLLRAELGHQSGLASLLRHGGASTRSAAQTASGDATFCGYGSHPLKVGRSGVTVVSGRPYAMGGNEWCFGDELRERYGVGSLDESTERLVALVDRIETEAVIFLAHDGPTGLGAARSDIWGRDFRVEGGDHGDTDLRRAIDHARSLGKRVLGVVAGHMHHPLEDGSERRWHVIEGGTHHVNAARLPRVRPHPDGLERHHVRLVVREDSLEVEERWLLDAG